MSVDISTFPLAGTIVSHVLCKLRPAALGESVVGAFSVSFTKRSTAFLSDDKFFLRLRKNLVQIKLSLILMYYPMT